MVQRQLDNVRGYTESLETAGKASAKIVQRPWTNCRRDSFLGTAVIAERTICSIQQEFARAW
jgi:hypothetical protein